MTRRSPRSHSRAGGAHGFTLVEIMISLAIVALTKVWQHKAQPLAQATGPVTCAAKVRSNRSWANRAAALARWRAFRDAKLSRYHEDRSDPLRDGTSRLSGALHFGCGGGHLAGDAVIGDQRVDGVVDDRHLLRGHVEELQVDKDFIDARDEPVEQFEVAAGHEQLEADLDPARHAGEAVDERVCVRARWRVERRDQPGANRQSPDIARFRAVYSCTERIPHGTPKLPTLAVRG